MQDHVPLAEQMKTLENFTSWFKVFEQTTVFNRYSHLFFLIIGLSLLVRLCSIFYTDLLVEEAYYWNYSIHLDFSYLDHPPMVALIIKLFTTIFGTNEFGVRIGALLGWFATATFSYSLAQLIKPGSGQYTLFLLAILPFFFLQSMVMTPDQPLILCWAASLFYLYRALVSSHSPSWFYAGIWLGLGMLSKYTIILLGPATLLYMCLVPNARFWFTRKEPYLCALIAILFFTPVIYWNATHHWVSFAFQGSRRLEASFYFSFHHLVGLLILFLMPPGILGLTQLLSKSRQECIISSQSRFFMLIFTLTPLLVFAIFSLTHEVKFNWIGPGLLALIPWFAALIHSDLESRNKTISLYWLITAICLLFSYLFLIMVITFGLFEAANRTAFKKFIDWELLTAKFNAIAREIELTTQQKPIFAPQDLYNIGSELAFYQAKLLAAGKIETSYDVVGRHIFGSESLMFRYWPHQPLAGKTLVLISNHASDFENDELKFRVIEKPGLSKIWSNSQGRGGRITTCYYKVVAMKDNGNAAASS